MATAATAEKPKFSTKDLRKAARSQKVDGWEEMTRAELLKAVNTKKIKPSANGASAATASKTTSKTASKAPAKKATAKKAAAAEEAPEPAENGNPYKPGTNMFLIAEELIRGGKRSDMVKRLRRKVELKPRTKDADDFDVDAELDRRVLIVGQNLRNNFGFNVVRDGRGEDAHIVAEAP